jgi:hypothetical protein
MTVAVPEAPPPHYLSVGTEIIDQIGIVVMHGPKSINALNEAFILEIVDALCRFDRDPAIHCMILRAGTPKYFSVGADMDEMSSRTFTTAIDEDFFTVGSHHQQSGRDRPMDKGRGYVHGICACCALCAMASCAALPCSNVTRVPGCSLYCPSTTTCSLALRPESINA